MCRFEYLLRFERLFLIQRGLVTLGINDRIGFSPSIARFWVKLNRIPWDKPKEMGVRHSALKEDLPTRLAEAERVGYGFVLPNEVVPNVPKEGLFVISRKTPATGILLNRMTQTAGV